MKYIRQYKQKTVRAENPEEFDSMINAIYFLAAASGKEPEIHYYEGMGLCASVKYYINEKIAEDICDEYELLGEKHYCFECPYFSKSDDRRIKKAFCSKGEKVYTDSKACKIFYEMLKGGLLNEESDLKDVALLHQ